MNEHELEEEAERVGWTVEYLKQHLAKEERIKTVFDKLAFDELHDKDKGYKGDGGGP